MHWFWWRNGLEAATTFDLTVVNVNDPPVVSNPINNQTAKSGEVFSFALALNTFTDPDVGDSLTYKASLANGGVLPAWLSFNPTTQTFSGTPADGNIGSLVIHVIATDKSGAKAEDSFRLTVLEENRPPEVTNPISDQTATENKLYSFTLPKNTFSDPDKDILTYQATLANGAALPEWLTFKVATDSTTGVKTYTFSGTPTADDVGKITIKVTAIDPSGAQDEDVFDLTVSSVNDPPSVVKPISDQTVVEDASFTFALDPNHVVDPDGEDRKSVV